MGTPRFRIYLDDKAATQDQLDQVEKIVVEQEVDKVWEARIEVPIRTDDKGKWVGADKSYGAAFGRIRVEIDPGDGSFVALIDGPIVGIDQAMSAEPGQSTNTAIVQDDSVLLNRNEQVVTFGKKLDHEVAKQIYDDADHHIADKVIDPTTKPPADGVGWEVQRGTEIQLLRRLASRQGMHAYVLPGRQPGKSVGLFKPYPSEPDGLPQLVLLGDDRNVETFTAREDAQGPASVSSQSLSVTDKSVVKATASFRDVNVLGDAASGEAIKVAAARILPPGGDGSVDADAAVRAAAERLSYSFTATGSVATDCYKAALSPYRIVTIKGINEELSGNYLIKKVTHQLTRSTYAQSFTLARNARSKGGGASGLIPKLF